MNRPILLLLATLCLSSLHAEDRVKLAGDNVAEIEGFLAAAEAKHGAVGGRAARFLVAGMPTQDLKTLKQDFLMENLDWAFKARAEFPWAQAVPEELFFNDVLPYASLDETRERWRPEMFKQASELVKDCASASEAAQVLNREYFNLIKVHYSTGRKRPNQSPAESRELGKASCSGLSIILVDACRAIGVPARIAGTPLWSNKRGNHTWVEIHDGGQWYFTGADEYKEQLNQAWFAGSAAKAIADDWKHAIWASSWKRTGRHFPMVWAQENREVGGVNVTGRYVAKTKPAHGLVPLHLRVWDREGGERIVVEITLADRTVRSKAGTADLNDMATLMVTPGEQVRIRLKFQDLIQERSITIDGEATRDLYWH